MRTTIRTTKALADIQRVRILVMLEKGELCFCQIVEVLGLAASTVSKHLSLLRYAGLVEIRKAGRWTYYRLPNAETAGNEAAHALRPLLAWLHESLKEDQIVLNDRAALEMVLSCDQVEIARGQRCR